MAPERDGQNPMHRMEAVVIGASAGALDALSKILPKLPQDFPLPILVVVHLPPDRESILARLLQSKCKLQVREAEDKETILAGTALVAPPDYHLLVEPNQTLSLSSEEPVNYSRPSIDVLFETAADAYGNALVGIILTGANNDGAKGLRAIEKAGGLCLIECPDQSYASPMPQAAIDACPQARVLTLVEIADALLELGKSV